MVTAHCKCFTASTITLLCKLLHTGTGRRVLQNVPPVVLMCDQTEVAQ